MKIQWPFRRILPSAEEEKRRRQKEAAALREKLKKRRPWWIGEGSTDELGRLGK